MGEQLEKGKGGEIYIPPARRVQDVRKEEKEDDPIDEAFSFSDKMLATDIKRSAAATARADRMRAEAEAKKAERDVEPPHTTAQPQDPPIKLTLDLGDMIRAKDTAIEAAQKATGEVQEKYFEAQAKRLEDMVARIQDLQTGGVSPKSPTEMAMEVININKEFQNMFPRPEPTSGMDAAAQIQLKSIDMNMQTQLKSMDQMHQIALLEANARLEEIRQNGLKMQMDSQKTQGVWENIIKTLGGGVMEAGQDFMNKPPGQGGGAPPHVGATEAGLEVYKCVQEDCGFAIPISPDLKTGATFACPQCGSQYTVEE